MESSTTLLPMRERIIVQKDPGAESVGRLILPESVRRPQSVGTVVAVGPGYFQGYDSAGEPVHRPTEYEVGDRVVVGEFAGVEIVLNGITQWIVVPDEINCKVLEDADALG